MDLHSVDILHSVLDSLQGGKFTKGVAF